MEYLRLRPIQGVSGQEPTAFTKKTIKELLEEEGVNASDLLVQSSPDSEQAIDPAAKDAPEQEAQASQAVAAAHAGPAMDANDGQGMNPAQAEQSPAQKKSLLGRLFGG